MVSSVAATFSLSRPALLLPYSVSFGGDDKKKPISEASAFVKPKEKSGADHLYEFLNALPDEVMLSLMKGLGMVGEKARPDVLKGKSKDVREIQKRALWLSSNILSYPFRDETTLDYHQLATWVASSSGVEKSVVKAGSTFKLERETQKQIFAELWDKLKPEQRRELLDRIDPNGHIQDKAAIAAMTGAGALGVLSLTVAFSGFAFYTTMAVTISTVAGFFGFTLPFVAYAGASSLVAFLSGPVGWAIMGLAALGGVALAGRANVTKTTAFICQIHALKIAALVEAGIPEKDVFG